MSRVKLPELPISKLEKTRLKRKYVKILGASEEVDDKMIGESITNYLLPEVDYKDAVCLDLGANIGAFTQLALDSGASKVVAVECDLRNFEKLQSAYSNDDYVDLVYAAVSGLPDKTLKIFKATSQNAHCGTSIMNKIKFNEYDEVENIHLKKLLKKYQPDIVIHLAAESHVDRSIDFPKDFVQNNILGTFNILEILRKKKLRPIFTQISTDEVFGSLKTSQKSFNENSLIKPNSPYSASKASADHLVRSYNKTFNFKTIITHSSNNFGERQHPEKLIPLSIMQLLNKKKIPIYVLKSSSIYQVAKLIQFIVS